MQRACLIDTDVLSFMFKGTAQAEPYAEVLRAYAGAISAISVGELIFGAEKARWGLQRRSGLEDLIAEQLVIPVDNTVAHHYGALVAELRRIGVQMGYSDAWIAATALRHGWPLATHNRRHFEHVPGLEIISFS